MKGSSPLMRGVLPAVTSDETVHGIIPAHAGSIQSATEPADSRRDHPRSCGEYSLLKLLFRYILGSSPLMRGVCKMKACKILKVGIIPAHAGSMRIA